MYALGLKGPPQEVSAGGRRYRLERLVKHDFWAATAFYVDAETGEPVVIKFGRSVTFLGLPMRWSGEWLTRRESRFYQRLGDVPGIPRWLGRVEGRLIGFVHAYVAGRPMSEVPAARLDERFFAELAAVLARLHERGIAYIDLNKPQNVLVGEGEREGLPWLIDFQISFDVESGLKRRLLPGFARRRLLKQAARADRYHFLKHKKRRRPDLLGAEERVEVERRAWFIRLHRTIARPYFFVRRRLMDTLRRKGRLLPEGSK